MSVQALASSGESARQSASQAALASQAAQAIAKELSSTVSTLELGLKAIREETDRQLEQLQVGPADAVAQAVTTLKGAAVALEEHINEVGKLHANVQADLTAQNEAAIATTKQHNVALEEQLSRSRQLVGQVHAALVDMTEGLARSVEGTA